MGDGKRAPVPGWQGRTGLPCSLENRLGRGRSGGSYWSSLGESGSWQPPCPALPCLLPQAEGRVRVWSNGQDVPACSFFWRGEGGLAEDEVLRSPPLSRYYLLLMRGGGLVVVECQEIGGGGRNGEAWEKRGALLFWGRPSSRGWRESQGSERGAGEAGVPSLPPSPARLIARCARAPPARRRRRRG